MNFPWSQDWRISKSFQIQEASLFKKSSSINPLKAWKILKRPRHKKDSKKTRVQTIHSHGGSQLVYNYVEPTAWPTRNQLRRQDQAGNPGIGSFWEGRGGDGWLVVGSMIYIVGNIFYNRNKTKQEKISCRHVVLKVGTFVFGHPCFRIIISMDWCHRTPGIQL